MTEPTSIDTRPLRVAQIGNAGPEHSTENHLRRAWQNNGHHVDFIQEDDERGWDALMDALMARHNRPDIVMWTTTASLAAKIPDSVQRDLLAVALDAGVPTVGYHLDRWWGLNREHLIRERPWFQQSLVVTADGGHPAEWAAAGVNHLWMPPGVSRDEALLEPSQWAPKYERFKVGWVGSWREYHPEWVEYRRALVGNLIEWYGNDLCIVEGGLRGQGLVDLYRTVPVIVGDSCLAPSADGSPMTRYWSDRCPETLGRGGYLIHPHVAGLFEAFTERSEPDEFGLATRKSYEGPIPYQLGNWDELHALIEAGLDHGGTREIFVEGRRAHVLANHTYEVRLEQLVCELQARDLLPTVLA